MDICLVVDSGEQWEMQWSFVLSHWNIDKIYLIGWVDPKVKTFQGAEIIRTADDLPDKRLVLMQPPNAVKYKGTQDLTTFAHPDDCIYMFGSDKKHLTEEFMGERVPDHTVYIPTDNHYEMFSWVAGGITLYDRRVKNG